MKADPDYCSSIFPPFNCQKKDELYNSSGGAAAGLSKVEDPRLVGSNIPPIVKPLRSSEDLGKPVLMVTRFGQFGWKSCGGQTLLLREGHSD